MYVNDLTLGYGERGRRGVERLMNDAFESGLIPARVPVEFAGS
jgi:1,4-dihydroxy-6-naphthoate synthase